jgi:hypothetical protein
MTHFIGCDNRNLLPPFLPVKRGEDVLFGLTMWKCFENSVFGHLPWALLHAPVEPRKFWPGELFRSASGSDMAKLLIDCLQSFDGGANQRDGSEQLRALGQHLMTLGSLNLPEFAEFTRLQAKHTNSVFIALMEEYLQKYGESAAFWAADVKKYRDLVCQALMRPDYWIPLDLVSGRGLEETQALAQRLVYKFGQLLYWWPDMVEAARDLRTQGHRMAVPV